MCILALCKLCGFCGIVCGLLEDFQWPVNTSLRKGILEAQDGVVVGVVCPLPSGPLRTLNEHFRL